MRKTNRFLLWYGLLTKRLLKRPGYLAVLLLVPLLTTALALATRQDSGVVTVAIACESREDPLSSAAVDRLLNEKSIVRFLTCERSEDAQNAVVHGEADAAWIFRGNASEMLEQYAENGRGTVVTVVEREDNVFLKLAREKLYAALYPELSFTVFGQFIRQLPNVSDNIPDAMLRSYYDSGTTDDPILRFVHIDGSEVQSADSYLTAPMRGLLSLLVILSGFASGMYCFKEEREEVFVWLPERKRRLLPFLCHLTAIVPTAAAALVSMAVTGVMTEPVRELILILYFCLAAAAFCELVRSICPTEAELGALIPVMMIAMLALCPVFLNVKMLRPLQYLLPAFYYLNAVHHTRYLFEMLLFTAGAVALSLTIAGLRQRG